MPLSCQASGRPPGNTRLITPLRAITAPSLIVSGAQDLPDFRLIAARLTAMLPGARPWSCPGPGTCPRWNDRRNCPQC
jgi:pimeloyl-ACP methyl ester carboxylesterase